MEIPGEVREAEVEEEVIPLGNVVEISDQEVEVSSEAAVSSTPDPGGKGSEEVNLSAAIELIDLEDDDVTLLGSFKKPKGLAALAASVKSRKTVDKRYKFCPCCGNILQVKYASKGKDSWRRKCRTCPYIQPIKRKHRYVVYSFKDEEDELQIVETSKADEHRQRTEIICPKCNEKEAFFYQMQTRSADEPMTTFYECVNKKCGNNWRD